jgi:hypothetical protein
MSTNISITVGDNALLDAAKQQQAANRQAQLSREASNRLEAQATAARTAALATQGRDANGNLITGTQFTQPQIDRRPAANRSGVETWIIYFNSLPTLQSTQAPGVNQYTHPYRVYNGQPAGDSLAGFVADEFTLLEVTGPFSQFAVGVFSLRLVLGKRNTWTTSQFDKDYLPVKTRSDSFCFEFDLYPLEGQNFYQGAINLYQDSTGDLPYYTISVTGREIDGSDELQIIVTRQQNEAELEELLNVLDTFALGVVTGPTGSWSQIAVVVQGSFFRLFVNGAVVASYSLNTPIPSGIYRPSIEMDFAARLNEENTNFQFPIQCSAMRFSCKARRTSAYVPAPLITP